MYATPTTHPSLVGQGAAEAESLWRNVVESSPVPTLLLSGGPDASEPGHIVYCNGAARQRFLLPSGDAVTESIFDLLSPVDHELVKELLSFERAEHAPIELELALLDHVGTNAGCRSMFALHLQSLDDDLCIAQLVRADGWSAADDALAEQHRFRSALLELSDLAHATQDDDEFYQYLLERAVEVVPGAQGGSVQLGIPGTTSFRFVAAVGYDLPGLQEHVLDRADFFRDAINPQAMIVREFTNTGRSPEIAEWLETVGRLSEIVVNVSAPVVVEGTPVAFVSMDNFEDPSAMSDTSIEMTTVLSRLIGDLWLRRRLEAELRSEREAFRKQALHDPLTGLANRRNLEQTLRDAVANNQPVAAPSAVLFVDIDDFKGVNDRLGHDVGDMLLIAVANGLRRVTDNAGLVGRWGGDEFLIVPQQVQSPDQVLEIAATILRAFEPPIRLAGSPYRVRLSVGVGWSDDSDLTSSHLVRLGDEALYRAKAEGKGTARLQRG